MFHGVEHVIMIMQMSEFKLMHLNIVNVNFNTFNSNINMTSFNFETII